jgi:phosphoserine phosphatase
MKIAVFLDVDRTLTQDYIQKDYAQELGCRAEYEKIEKQFQDKQISSSQFGTQIIALFASKQLTEDRAEELFSCVVLQPWTDELFALEVDKYLVSSGPGYYIDELAKRHGIPAKNVCRSVYKFNKKTKLIESCNAVDEQYKADFVRGKVGQYDLTIGIGDNLEFDGPFVSHCTIQLLTVANASTLHIENFGAAIPLINRLLKLKGPGHDAGFEADTLSIPQLASRLSLGSWALLFALIGGAFGLGTEWSNVAAALGHFLKSK